MKRTKLYLTPLIALIMSLFALSGAWAGDGVVNTSVTDFRVTLDRTATDPSKGVNVVVELLNDQGKVDLFGETSVDHIYVSVGTAIGTLENAGNETDDQGQFSAQTGKYGITNGKTGFHIKYTRTGTDTLIFYVVIVDTDGDTKTLGPKEYTIQVNQAPNQADELQVVSMTPNDLTNTDNKAIVYWNSTTVENDNATDDLKGQIDAGEAFTLLVKAVKDGNYTTYQNGPITVTFIPENTNDTDGNTAYDSSCSNVVSVEGEMVNGIAYVNVPADTLTKAGKYLIYVEGESQTGTISNVNKYLEDIFVDALAPDHLGAKLLVSDLDNNATANSAITVYAYDKYGNRADKDKITENITFSATATNDLILGTTSSISSGDNEVNVGISDAKSVTISSNGKGTSTISFSSDAYPFDDTLTVNVYDKMLAVNGTYATDNNGAGNYTDGFDLTAGIVYDDIIQVGLNTKDANASNADDFDTLAGKQIKVELYDNATDELVDSVTTIVGKDKTVDVWNGTTYNTETLNGTVSLKFNKAFDGNGYFKIYYLGDDAYYAPAKTKVFQITISPASASTLKMYKKSSTNYNACYDIAGQHPTETVSSLSEYGTNATFTVYGSENSSINADNYFIQLEDAYGNKIDDNSTKIYWRSDAEAINPSPTSGSFVLNASTTINYSTYGTDNLTFYTDTPGVESLEIPVTIILPSKVASVEILPGSDYLLANGEIPLVIRAYDDNGNLKSWGSNELYIAVSNPDYVTLRQSDRTTKITSGDALPASSSGEEVLSLVASNTASDITITVRNVAGTISASKTIHIVNSVNDIPASVSSVAFDVNTLTMGTEKNATATITVTDSEGNGLSGKTCTISSDAESVVDVTTPTVITGSDGKAEVSLSSNDIESTAHITATCEGISDVLTVTVTTEQATCDADHLDLCTTEEACTGAGGYWYDDACHSEQQVQPQPVPTEPTTEELTGDEIQNAPVQVGDVATGGDTMELAVNFPAHADPVDLYAAIALPDGSLLVLNSDNELVTNLVPFKTNTTDAVSATIFDSFPVCTPFGAAIPEGTYSVFTLVLPAGTDLMSVDWANDPYELTYYSFDVSCE